MTRSPWTHAATPGTQPRSSCPPLPPAPSAGLSCAPAAARAWLPPGFRVPSTSGAGQDVPWHSRLARSHRRPGIRLPLPASGVGGRPEGLRPRTWRDAVPGGTPGCTGRHRACLVSLPHGGAGEGVPGRRTGVPWGGRQLGTRLCVRTAAGTARRGVGGCPGVHTHCSPHHHHLPRSLVTRWLRAQRGFAAPETVGLFLAAFPAAACEYLQRARWADSTGSRPGSASPARPGAAPRGPAPAPGTGVGRGRWSPRGRSPRWGPPHGQGCPQLGPFPLSTMGPASLPRGTELTAALCSVCRQGGEGGKQLRQPENGGKYGPGHRDPQKETQQSPDGAPPGWMGPCTLNSQGSGPHWVVLSSARGCARGVPGGSTWAGS